MAIVRWDPLRELAGMEVDRLNRMFSEFYSDAFSNVWVPPVDIYETQDHEVVLKAELPELKREDIHVTFENGVLTIRGERKTDESVKRDNVCIMFALPNAKCAQACSFSADLLPQL